MRAREVANVAWARKDCAAMGEEGGARCEFSWGSQKLCCNDCAKYWDESAKGIKSSMIPNRLWRNVG